MRIEQLKLTIPYLLKAGISILIHGFHGRGKSDSVRQFCADNGYMLKDIRLGTQETGDLLGLQDFKVDPNTGKKVCTEFFMPSWLREIFDYCQDNPTSAAIIFLDEINRARRELLQAVFQLVLDKQLHTYKLPQNCYVIAACNPNSGDYSVTDIGDKALMGRFCHIKLEPTVTEWLTYGKNNSYDIDITDFVKEQPEMLENTKLEDFKLDDIVERSRRNWSALDRVVKLNPPEDLLRGIAFGLIGTEATLAWMKFKDRDDKPLLAEDVISHYTKHQPKVVKWSSVESGRQDQLHHTADKLFDYLTKRTKKLTKKEEDNLINWMIDIPAEISFDLGRKIYPIEIARSALDRATTWHEKLKVAKEGGKLVPKPVEQPEVKGV